MRALGHATKTNDSIRKKVGGGSKCTGTAGAPPCCQSGALITATCVHSSLRVPETPLPWQAPQGKQSGGVLVSATATFRRNPDGANRARDRVKPGEVANDQG
jgi:hypothetical protein